MIFRNEQLQEKWDRFLILVNLYGYNVNYNSLDYKSTSSNIYKDFVAHEYTIRIGFKDFIKINIYDFGIDKDITAYISSNENIKNHNCVGDKELEKTIDTLISIVH